MKQDVIETPLDPVFDINGWDLGKALKLLLKGNAVVVEWLTSPVRYRGDPALREALSGFAAVHLDRSGLVRHYRHLGERQRLLTLKARSHEMGTAHLPGAVRVLVEGEFARAATNEIFGAD